VPEAFGDTYFWIAFLNPRDTHHARAVQLFRTPDLRIVVTAWVMAELADGLAARAGRRRFAPFLARCRANPHIDFIDASQTLFDEGVALYDQRPDKHWSLTDCTSFAVMRARGITEALTGDHHFEQAGFVAMMK
jgi:predicted nucleic acid-binding protein